MYLKKLRLFFMFLLAILFNQSCSLLATTPQTKENQITMNILAIHQANKIYRKKVIFRMLGIGFYYFNLLFFWKKMYDISNLLTFSYLFFICSFRIHLNSLLTKGKNKKIDTSFGIILIALAITLKAIFARKVIETLQLNSKQLEVILHSITFLISLTALAFYTIKEYDVSYLQQADKSFLSSIKSCISAVWLDWLIFILCIVGIMITFITDRKLIMSVLLMCLLPQVYAIRESLVLVEDWPRWASLCSIIEVVIALYTAYVGLTISIDAAAKAILFASIWVIFKNLTFILLTLIKRYQQRLKYRVDS